MTATFIIVLFAPTILLTIGAGGIHCFLDDDEAPRLVRCYLLAALLTGTTQALALKAVLS